jgi:uncharacterized protein with GYD domain
MKKIQRVLASAVVAGSVFASTIPTTEAADFMPIYVKPTSEFPFTDVPLDYKDVVSKMYTYKFMQGISKDKFGWNMAIKRVDAALIVAHGMGFRKTNSTREGTLAFKDVPDRAYEAISDLQNAGVVHGKTETFFGSNDVITRGEAAIIFSRAYDSVLLSPDESTHEFTDATGRYANAINRLAATGITAGKTATQFGTNDFVTRGEFALMMYRLSDPSLSPSPYGELPSTQDGLTLKADKESYSMSTDTAGVILTTTNTGSSSYDSDHGEYNLEKKQGDKWLSIRYRHDQASSLPIRDLIEPNGTLRAVVGFGMFKPPITPGEYRLVQNFWNENGSRDQVDIAAYFTITE